MNISQETRKVLPTDHSVNREYEDSKRRLSGEFPVYHHARNQSVQIMENEITDNLVDECFKTQNNFGEPNDYMLKSDPNIAVAR